MPTKCETALALANLGFPVFPLRPNSKKPAIKDWPNQATVDADNIKTFWADHPDANIGISTKNLVVIDIDQKEDKDGEQTLLQLTQINDPLPATFTIETPSGGRHLYFQADPATPIKSGVNVLGEGLDIRAQGGYVVGPGSILDGITYNVASNGGNQLAALPDWVGPYTTPPAVKGDNQNAPPSALDQPANIARAKEYLQQTPGAVQGAGGDQATYVVAAKLKDYGLSQPAALELLLDHWNNKCQPPWSPEALLQKVKNAYTYGTNPPGLNTPEADFGPPPKPGGKSFPTLVEPFKSAELPPRDWIYGNLILGGIVSVLISPPGIGKSTFTLGIALALVTTRDLLGITPTTKTPVWLFNNEDDNTELKRRLAALMLYHRIPWRDLGQRLYLDSGTNQPLLIAKRDANGALRPNKAHIERIIKAVKKHKIRVFIADPFIETHEANENDNVEINLTARIYRHIAQETGAGVLLVHHTRKPPQAAADGFVGNMDAGRGASALMGVARIVKTCFAMSPRDAKTFGIPVEEKRWYIRVDDAKANMSLICDDAVWLKRVSVTLLNGDDVGILEPIKLEQEPEMYQELLQDIIIVLEDHEKGLLLPTLTRELIDKMPMYQGIKFVNLRRQIVHTVEKYERHSIDGKSIELTREKRNKGDQKTILIRIVDNIPVKWEDSVESLF